jgi:peptidoglycan-associated lipoprotein
MGYPMNSNSNDFGIIFDGDFERGYFTSDRAGGKGKDDIYEFSLPEVLFAFEGIVYDKDNQQPLVNSYVRVVGSDGSSFEANTDGNGSFIFGANGDERYINPDVNYSIEVGKEKYLVAKDNISTVNLSGESTNFVKEFFLQPVIEGKGISMPEVQYELAKWQLLPQSRDSLDYLYNIMSDNPTIVVQLEAHTDSRGSDANNQNLSQKRAQSCVDYLISKGIPGARMKARGFGESRLKISDAQIAAAGSKEEKERLHQLNRRTEFSILSWDYSPK